MSHKEKSGGWNLFEDFSYNMSKNCESVFAVRGLDINQVPSIQADQEEWITAGMEDEEDSSNGSGPPRKKLRLTKEQSRLLEESFRQHHTLNPVRSYLSCVDRIN